MNHQTKVGNGEKLPGLTPAEYARAHGVTIDWVYRMIRAGQLPASRVFGRLFITYEVNHAKRR